MELGEDAHFGPLSERIITRHQVFPRELNSQTDGGLCRLRNRARRQGLDVTDSKCGRN